MKARILAALKHKGTWTAIAGLMAALGLALSPEVRAAIGQLLIAFGITSQE